MTSKFVIITITVVIIEIAEIVNFKDKNKITSKFRSKIQSSIYPRNFDQRLGCAAPKCWLTCTTTWREKIYICCVFIYDAG